MTDSIHRFTVCSRESHDPQADALKANAHLLGFRDIQKLDVQELYFIQGQLSPEEINKINTQLLCDPIIQICEAGGHAALCPPYNNSSNKNEAQTIEVLLRPGVTDPTATEIMRSAQLLGINNIKNVATGKHYKINSARQFSEQELHVLAKRLLANPVIQQYTLGTIEAAFPTYKKMDQTAEIISLRKLTDDQLLALSQQRRAALDLPEMQAIQKYFQKIDRDPTDVEFEMIAQTWSEHCYHKTFRAEITTNNNQKINGLLKTYIRSATEEINAPWVWSAFVDNAGIIDFDDEYHVSFKVETHNHPSAIEPFGGANTGLGGVIRDLLGVSAKPIAATDVFCFGMPDCAPQSLPENVLHPLRIRSGVVAGVQDYGNKTGIPTVNGAIFYDPGYTANPLVYCGCVGLAPKNSHKRAPQLNDRIIVLGGRTGRDGLRGATFSSMTMDKQTETVASSSVQIGDPIIAKGLIEVITRARDAGLYNAITDCGAGGLSSAIGEMASENGAEVDIALAPLKYPGLAPWEIWLSEAQERMVLAVPPEKLAALKDICRIYDIELTDLGFITNTKKVVVKYESQIVLNLDAEFLFEGVPQKKLQAEIRRGERRSPVDNIKNENHGRPPVAPTETLLKLLAHPNIASKANVIRRYDHEIQGGTVVKPLTGVMNDGPSDACVLKPFGTKGLRGIVLSNGINPELGKHDPYNMALSVIDEAIRNAVAVGANPDRIAILDNFCWGNPNRPETLGALVEAARGCYDGALHYQTPFISGKDSLYNEYQTEDGIRHAIPPTLLISAIGIIEDVTKAVTMDLKKAGNSIYLLGDSIQHAPQLYRTLHQAMQQGLVRACHDLSEGGLAVALAEMCIGGRLGCEINIDQSDLAAELFAEVDGRLLVEIEEKNKTTFENLFKNQAIKELGRVTQQAELVVQQQNQQVFSISVNQLVTAWQTNI
jgi:phosphoribosylformylglycinamidine synthase subunit PurSL